MKHVAEGTDLRRLLAALDLAPSDEVLDRVLEHLLWVIETNARINLTGITDIGAAVRLHAVDSLAAIPELVKSPAGPALDLGTGGGFPGLPLAIATGREFVLLDSVAKKATAVQEFVTEHEPTIARTSPDRAEQHARSHPDAYSVVVARAVAALPSLVELASPLLKPGGELLAMKGPISGEELARGDAVAAITGMQRFSLREYRLPEGDEQRSVVVYRRTGQPKVVLPRREGQAQRSPLA